MRKENNRSTQNYFSNEIEETKQIINPQPKSPIKAENNTALEWAKLLNKKLVKRVDGKDVLRYELMIGDNNEFDLMFRIKGFAEEYCGGNMKLAMLQLAKKGLEYEARNKR